MTNTPTLDGWTPVEIETADTLVAAPVRRLSAVLDHDTPPWSDGMLPPLAHWLFFLPEARQSALGSDGHPLRGADLPPVDAPRRMWAGGRVDFVEDISLGAEATRRSKVVKVQKKQGRSGALIFVTVGHEIRVHGRAAIVEMQDLVYREDEPRDAETIAASTTAPEPRTAERSRPLMADAALLFRYSALTFNAHRIHYDLPYARDVEHYAGLVVHGPLQATLLVDHLLRTVAGAQLKAFTFRGLRPLIAGTPFTVNLAHEEDGVVLWTADADGHTCMQARAVLV